jgi:hypothetical protein
MASCFVCGCTILKGTAIRRAVYTGSSVGGFNLASNLVLNLILNSLLSRRRPSVRSYYSTRTICLSCDSALTIRERRKLMGIAAILGFFALLVLIGFMAQR